MSTQLTLAGRRIVIVGCTGSGKVLKDVVPPNFVEYIGRTISLDSRVAIPLLGHSLPSTALEGYSTRHIS